MGLVTVSRSKIVDVNGIKQQLRSKVASYKKLRISVRSISSFSQKLLQWKLVDVSGVKEQLLPKAVCCESLLMTWVQGQLPPHSVFFLFLSGGKGSVWGTLSHDFWILPKPLPYWKPNVDFHFNNRLCDWLCLVSYARQKQVKICNALQHTLTVFAILMKVSVWYMHCGAILCSLRYSWSWILNWIIGSISSVIMFYCLYLCSSLTVGIFASTWFHRHQVICLRWPKFTGLYTCAQGVQTARRDPGYVCTTSTQSWTGPLNVGMWKSVQKYISLSQYGF